MIDFTLIAFVLFGCLGIGGAMWLLLARNILYAALGFLMTLVSIAAFFALLGADFLAVAQVVVYVGGVLVLLIFGIMFTHRKGTEGLLVGHHNRLSSTFIALLVATGFGYLIHRHYQDEEIEIVATTKPTTEHLGKLFLTEYAYAFELAGVLLLVALVAAAFLVAHQSDQSEAD